MNKWITGIVGVLAMTLTIAWGQHFQSNRAAPIEEKLGEVPKPMLGAFYSKNGCHAAYIIENGDKELIVLDGKKGPVYDGIENLVFSPDGKRVAYSAKKGQNELMVLDGQEGPEYEGIIRGAPTFHSDGTLEYLAVKERFLYRVKHRP